MAKDFWEWDTVTQKLTDATTKRGEDDVIRWSESQSRKKILHEDRRVQASDIIEQGKYLISWPSGKRDVREQTASTSEGTESSRGQQYYV